MVFKAENLVVQGKCFFPGKMELKTIQGLKNLISTYMAKKHFQPDDFTNIFEPDKYLSMNYTSQVPLHPYLSLRIKKFLGLTGQAEFKSAQYFHSLIKYRDDLPFNVTVSIIPGKAFKRNGFIIAVRSEPTLFQKICQLGWNPNFIFSGPSGLFTYSKVIEKNVQFIEEFFFGIGARVLEAPKAKNEYEFEPSPTPTIEEMEKAGFADIATIIKGGRAKIERGDIEDGITDLRASLEQFARSIVKRVGKKPAGSIKANLKTLSEMGYFDDKFIKLVSIILDNWLHKVVHDRYKMKYLDAKFLYSLIEDFEYFLLQKIVYRKG